MCLSHVCELHNFRNYCVRLFVALQEHESISFEMFLLKKISKFCFLDIDRRFIFQKCFSIIRYFDFLCRFPRTATMSFKRTKMCTPKDMFMHYRIGPRPGIRNVRPPVKICAAVHMLLKLPVFSRKTAKQT